MREQLIAQVGRHEAAPDPRLARRATHSQPAATAHERACAPAPLAQLARDPLEAEDRQAAAAVAARAQVHAPERIPDPSGARERERGLRLLLVGQTRHLGHRMLLGQGPQRLCPGREVGEEESLIDALLRRRAHAQREPIDHAERPLRADQQLTQAGTGGGGGDRGQLDIARRGSQAQAEHHLVDRAVPAGGLARRARGDAAAERHVLERLREVPERERARLQVALERRGAHAALDAHGEGAQVEVDQLPHAAHVERQHCLVGAAQRRHAAHHAGAAAEWHHRHRPRGAQLQQRAHLIVRAWQHDRVGRRLELARAQAHEVRIASAGRVGDAFGAILAHGSVAHDRPQARERGAPERRPRQLHARQRHRGACTRRRAQARRQVAQRPGGKLRRARRIAPPPPAHRR